MKNIFPRLGGFVLLCLCIMFQISCAARINGSLAADGSASIFLNMSLEPNIISLIRTFQAAGGEQIDGAVFEGDVISKSLSAAPGIASVSLKNISPSSIEGVVEVSKINEFLSAAGLGQEDAKRFINFEQNVSGGKCAVNINLENGHAILKMFSLEVFSFLEILMAPIATGLEEFSSKEEYLEEVAEFYNKAISDEIAVSRVRAFIEFPGAIKSVNGGTFFEKTAVFDLALLDILVLETPIVLEVEWE